MFNDRIFVKKLKEQYPVGTRIEVDYMGDDFSPIEPGTQGTVMIVDDTGTIHCNFDNGRRMGLIIDIDRFHVIP